MSTSMRHVSGTAFTALPPAMRPRLTDGPSKSSDRSDANGSAADAAVEVDRLEHGVLAQPRRASRGRRGRAPRSARPARPWPGRRSAGRWARRRSRTRPGCRRRRGGRSPSCRSTSASDSSSGAIRSFTRMPGEAVRGGGQIGERREHRGERALHVVGAAAVEAAVLAPRRELVAVAGDDVDVRAQDERARAVADGRDDRGPAVHVDDAVADALPLEPAAQEPDARCGSPPRSTCRSRSGSRPGQDRRHRSRPDCGRPAAQTGSDPFGGSTQTPGTHRNTRVARAPRSLEAMPSTPAYPVDGASLPRDVARSRPEGDLPHRADGRVFLATLGDVVHRPRLALSLLLPDAQPLPLAGRNPRRRSPRGHARPEQRVRDTVQHRSRAAGHVFQGRYDCASRSKSGARARSRAIHPTESSSRRDMCSARRLGVVELPRDRRRAASAAVAHDRYHLRWFGSAREDVGTTVSSSQPAYVLDPEPPRCDYSFEGGVERRPRAQDEYGYSLRRIATQLGIHHSTLAERSPRPAKRGLTPFGGLLAAGADAAAGARSRPPGDGGSRSRRSSARG